MSLRSIWSNLSDHFHFISTFADEAKFGFKGFLPVFIALLLPLVYPLIITLTYAQQTVVERTAVIYDEDNSAFTRQLTLDFDATQGLNIVRMVDSVDEGMQAVMSRNADAFIYFPSDFSAQLKRNEQGDLKVYVYATNMMIYASAMTAIQNVVLDENTAITVERVMHPKGIIGDKALHTVDPIQYDRSFLYAPTLAYGSYITPLLFVLVFHQMGMLLLSLTIGYHRELHPEFNAKKIWLIDYFNRFLFYIPFIILGICIVYGIYAPALGMPTGNRLEIAKIILLMTLVNFPIGASLASCCRDRFTCFFILLATSLVFFSYSGYVWPRYAIPDYLIPLSDALAIQPVSTIVRGITFKNAQLSDFPNEISQLIHLFFPYLIASLVIVHRHWLLFPFKALAKKISSSKNKQDSSDHSNDNNIAPSPSA